MKIINFFIYIMYVGVIGAFSSISQLFRDDIHLNNTGNAFMAYLMYVGSAWYNVYY